MAASNINRVIITGNLTADPELRSLPSGTSICKLRVACNTRRKDNSTDEWVDKPNYFDVTVWGAQGENCARYLSKGRPVAIDGRLEWREWESPGGPASARRSTSSPTPSSSSPARATTRRRQRRRLHPALGHPRRHGATSRPPRRAAARARRPRPTTTSRSRPLTSLPRPGGARVDCGYRAPAYQRLRAGSVRDRRLRLPRGARGYQARTRQVQRADNRGTPRWTSTTTTR